MAPTLHTARLVMTPVGDHDLAPLHAHWNDPQVARWLWDATPVPLKTVSDLVARSTQTFQHAGWGLWALRPATEAPLIGACGLSLFDPAPGTELLYSLAPTHWSKGLATEAATAVLAYAPPPHPPPRHPHAPGPGRPPHLPLLPHPPPHTDPGMLLQGPCSSMDRATDF
jgi:RimJ/RimL family protein N-acetyltransferase